MFQLKKNELVGHLQIQKANTRKLFINVFS